MTDKIRGKWPGGPKGRADAEPIGRRIRTRPVADLEDRVAAHRVRRKREARARRVLLGFAASLGLAGVIGWVVGERSHASAEEITAEHDAAVAPVSDLTKELNRAMLELWRMEDVEFMRNRPRP